MATFPDRLKELRIARGETQVNMAKLLDCAERHYQKLEYGTVKVTPEKLIILADFFNVSIDYLMGRTNYWTDSDGNITVKVPADILNLDTDELRRKLKSDKD